MCNPARVIMLWLRRRRLPEQVDRAGSIALVPRSRKLEEGRDLHINTSNGAAREPRNKPIVTGSVEIRRLPCLFLSKSNGGARKVCVFVCVCVRAVSAAVGFPGVNGVQYALVSFIIAMRTLVLLVHCALGMEMSGGGAGVLRRPCP